MNTKRTSQAELKTRIFFDMHLPQWDDKQVATCFDVDLLAKTLIDCAAESVILYAKCQYGNAYYDTHIGHKHTGLGSLDFLREMTTRLHAAGKEVLAYYSVAWDELQAKLHPEWLTVDYAGNHDSEEFRWKTLCINSPFRTYVLAQLQEIARETEVDGFWIDMTIIGSGRCYCEHCQKKYADSPFSTTIKELLPQGMERKDSDFLNFRFDYVEEFYREVYQLLHRTRSNLKILNNYWGYPYSPLTMGSRAIGAQREADVVTGEAYTDWTGLESPEFFSRFLRGVARQRPFEALIGRFVNTWDFTRKPFDQLFFECMTVFSHGGTITLDDEPYFNGTFDTVLYEYDLRMIFQTVQQYGHAREGERLCYAAVYHSQETKIHEDQAAFIKDIVGSYKLFRDAHIPVDFVFDEDTSVEQLNNYKVIFLPCVSHLGQTAIETLLEYAEQGGLLVSCGLTALSPRLQDFGLQHYGCSDYSVSYIQKNHEYLLVRGRFEHYAAVMQPCNSSMRVVNPIVETSSNEFYHNNLPSPYEESEFPVFITLPIGSGNIILFNQMLARSYAKQPSIGIRRLVLQEIFNHKPNPQFNLIAPKRVASEVYLHTDNRRVYIHLMVPGCDASLSCGLLDTMQGNFERPYVYMEEKERVGNIRIELHLERKVRAVTSIYEKNHLLWDQKGSLVSIDLDGVSLWDIIEVSYE
jgi:hypothetical protein